MNPRMYRLLLAIVLFSACHNPAPNLEKKPGTSGKTAIDSPAVVSVAAILSKKQVPILCYHHIKNGRPNEYTVTPQAFAAQMQVLEDSGYTAILPAQLYAYLTKNEILPAKPVMLTFDDTDLEQYTVGYTEMKKHHFKGVFFIMNISINRPRYMSADQLKQLSDDGNLIAAHTWDHHSVKNYTEADWVKQLDEPIKKLKAITGKPVDYFAYPFGLWNQAAIPALQQHGMNMAFQLSTPRDSVQPLYTIRRMIVPSGWSPAGMLRAMKKTFQL